VSGSRKSSFAILASGRGSNAEAILAALAEGRIQNAECKAVISNREGAGVIEVANRFDSKVFVLKTEAEILAQLQRLDVSWVVLAGFMKILSKEFLSAFKSGDGFSRVVNVHPSLLPAFPGRGGYAQAFEHGCVIAGATVHLVTEEMDAGPICAQGAFSIADCKNVEEVEAKGLATEHAIYPETIDWLLSGRFRVVHTDGGRSRVRPN
jgi:phosphoribosylglycinamide formyltransferase-1